MKDSNVESVALPWAKEFEIQVVCDNFPTFSGGSFLSWVFLLIIFVTAVYLFSFGYRFYRFSSFLISGLLGATFCYLLCSSENVLEPYINGAIALVCGVLCAIIASLHSKLGFFLTGFCVGSTTGMYILTFVSCNVVTLTHVFIYRCILCCCSVAVGILQNIVVRPYPVFCSRNRFRSVLNLVAEAIFNSKYQLCCWFSGVRCS